MGGTLCECEAGGVGWPGQGCQVAEVSQKCLCFTLL